MGFDEFVDRVVRVKPTQRKETTARSKNSGSKNA